MGINFRGTSPELQTLCEYQFPRLADENNCTRFGSYLEGGEEEDDEDAFFEELLTNQQPSASDHHNFTLIMIFPRFSNEELHVTHISEATCLCKRMGEKFG